MLHVTLHFTQEAIFRKFFFHTGYLPLLFRWCCGCVWTDSVLSVIRHHLHKFWEFPATQRAVEVTMASRSNRFIRFVPAGTTLPLQSHQRRPLSSQTLLFQANDWEYLFDLDEQLQFPPEVAVTSLRPDVVILSRSTKTVIMLELTVPLEDRSHLAYDRKSSKYSALVTACE